MGRIWQDARATVRRLREAPGSAIAAILLLAIGISVNSSFFSLVDGSLLRALPEKDPDQLVSILFAPHGASRFTASSDFKRRVSH